MLDMFVTKGDIRNALQATNEGSAQTAAMVAPLLLDTAQLRAFRIGYRAALITVAVAFGLPPSALGIEEANRIEE